MSRIALAGALVAALVPAAALAPETAPAFAADSPTKQFEKLNADYRAASATYQDALDRQAANAQRIVEVERESDEAQAQLEDARERLETASVALYKNATEPFTLLETLLSARTLQESIAFYESYVHIQSARQVQFESARADCDDARGRLADIQAERDELEREVEAAHDAVTAAKEALRSAVRLDGAKYHQRQKNGQNCGATAFIVGVNIMLGENRYKDNEEVWASKAFGRNSAENLAAKGQAWLKDNDLDGELSFANVPGDVLTAEKMRSLLEAGSMVVISSGTDSVWQRAGDAEPVVNGHPYGHYIVFYGYSEGVFYANDSSEGAKRGAGCPYTTEQMQQWLDGRSWHAACALSRV